MTLCQELLEPLVDIHQRLLFFSDLGIRSIPLPTFTSVRRSLIFRIAGRQVVLTSSRKVLVGLGGPPISSGMTLTAVDKKTYRKTRSSWQNVE
jgi:hypothetical protein